MSMKDLADLAGGLSARQRAVTLASTWEAAVGEGHPPPSRESHRTTITSKRQKPFPFFTAVDKDVLCNSFACAGASMTDPFMSLVDTGFVGRLGLVQLAALGPNAALFNVIFFLAFTALCVVCTEYMAAANSRRDLEGVGRAFITTLVIAWVIGIFFMLLLNLAPTQALLAFQANEELLPHARVYCAIRALSLPASMTNIVCQAAFRSLLDLRTPLLVVAVAGVTNLILDSLLMFYCGLGIAGAGWASVGAQYVGTALFGAVVFAHRRRFGLVAAAHAATHAHVMKSNVSLPHPSGLHAALLVVHSLHWRPFLQKLLKLATRSVLILTTYTAASLVASREGTSVIAGHQVVQQLQQLQLTMIWAFLHVGQSMVANVHNGPNGHKAARALGDRIIMWAFCVALSLSAATYRLRGWLPRLFVQHEEVLQLVSQATAPACVMLALSWNSAVEGCLLGTGDSTFVVRMYPWAVSAALSVLGLNYYRHAGLSGVWWGLATYYLVLLLAWVTRYYGSQRGVKLSTRDAVVANGDRTR